MIRKQQKCLLKLGRRLGLTQAQVAKKAGINANYYARVERGGAISSSGQSSRKLAVALNVDLSSLTDE